jgi:hypothetical protein
VKSWCQNLLSNATFATTLRLRGGEQTPRGRCSKQSPRTQTGNARSQQPVQVQVLFQLPMMEPEPREEVRVTLRDGAVQVEPSSEIWLKKLLSNPTCTTTPGAGALATTDGQGQVVFWLDGNSPESNLAAVAAVGVLLVRESHTICFADPRRLKDTPSS